MNQLETAQPERKRPFGIYAVIVLQILNVAVNFSDFLRAQLGMATTALPNIEDPRIAGILSILLAIVLIGVIIGLWRYRRWAWFAAMVLQGIALIVGIWQYFHGGTPYINLLLNTLIVFYLNQRDVRRIFEDPAAGRGTRLEVSA